MSGKSKRKRAEATGDETDEVVAEILSIVMGMWTAWPAVKEQLHAAGYDEAEVDAALTAFGDRVGRDL